MNETDSGAIIPDSGITDSGIPYSGRVLPLIGGSDREEFQAPRQAIYNLAREHSIEPIEAYAAEVLKILSVKECIAIVLCESFPGEYSRRFLCQTRRGASLAPVILLAGDLCEGEGRTGDIPAGIVRVCRRHWRGFFSDDLEPFLTGGTGRLALPPIAADEDYLISRELPIPAEKVLPARNISPTEAIPCHSPNGDSSESRFAPICVVTPYDRALGNMIADFWRQKEKGSELFTIDTLLAARAFRMGDPERIVIDSVDRETSDMFPAVEKLSLAYPRSQIDILLFAPRNADELLFAPLTNVRLVAKPFV